jgi:hypothetical protein
MYNNLCILQIKISMGIYTYTSVQSTFYLYDVPSQITYTLFLLYFIIFSDSICCELTFYLLLTPQSHLFTHIVSIDPYHRSNTMQFVFKIWCSKCVQHAPNDGEMLKHVVHIYYHSVVKINKKV